MEHAGGTRTIRTSRVEHEAYESGELKYETQTLYQYDSYDNVTLESDLNDVSTAADDVYSLTAYVNDTAQWRIGVVSINRTCADAACGAVRQRVNTYYDDLPLGQVGARGEVTRSSAWRSDTNTWVGSNFTYDAAGSLLTRTNAAGTISQRNEYDAASGDLVRSNDALGHTVSNEYDEVTGELIAVTEPNGNTLSFGYDAFGRKNRTESPHDGTTRSLIEESLSFNPNLEVLTVHTDRGTLVTTKHLDGLGRVWKATQTWDDGTLLQTDTYFDEAGREYRSCPQYRAPPAGAISPPLLSNCTTRYFDAAGRVVRVDAPRSGSWGDQASTLTAYDGYRTTVTDPLGHVTVTDYDPATLTSTLTQPGGLITRTQKDLLGRAIAVTDPAGIVATYTYNSLGWKLTDTDPVSGRATVAYDVLGNLISQTDAAGNTTQDVLRRRRAVAAH